MNKIAEALGAAVAFLSSRFLPAPQYNDVKKAVEAAEEMASNGASPQEVRASVKQARKMLDRAKKRDSGK